MLARSFVLSVVFAVLGLAAGRGIADSRVGALQKQRAEAAERVFTTTFAQAKSGRATVEAVATWSVRWLDSERERAGSDAKAKAKALADHAARMAELEAWAGKAAAAGTIGPADAQAAVYFRIEADLWLTAKP